MQNLVELHSSTSVLSPRRGDNEIQQKEVADMMCRCMTAKTVTHASRARWQAPRRRSGTSAARPACCRPPHVPDLPPAELTPMRPRDTAARVNDRGRMRTATLGRLTGVRLCSLLVVWILLLAFEHEHGRPVRIGASSTAPWALPRRGSQWTGRCERRAAATQQAATPPVVLV